MRPFASSDIWPRSAAKHSFCAPMGTLGTCSDDMSSDDDEEHNINNTLLLLVAAALIAPVLLSGLSHVDELMVALGCRFALDLLSRSQHDWTGGPPPACHCCAIPGVAGQSVPGQELRE